MTKQVFADTLYWLAMARPGDQWQASARRARDELGDAILVTSDEVPGEFLNAIGPRAPGCARQPCGWSGRS